LTTEKKSEQVHIRCSECGTFNTNKIHCDNCGALLSVIKQRELVRQQRVKEVRKREAEKGPSPMELRIKKMQNHRFWLVRAVFEVVYIGWVIAMAVGGFIAWVIAAIVA